MTNSPSIRAALAHYAPFLTDAPSVVAGDFNSSSAWDKPNRLTNHALAVTDLQECGLASAYHQSAGCPPGAELDPTLFQGRNISSGFHIDYCFAPESWLGAPGRVAVGRPEEWLPISDHMPLIVDLEPSAAESAHATSTA